MFYSIEIKYLLPLTMVIMSSLVIGSSPVKAEENIFNFVARKFRENDINITNMQNKDQEIERKIIQLESDNLQLRSDLKAQLQMIDALISRINKQEP